MTTLAEKNRLYQQRFRAKMKVQLGKADYLQEKRDYMRMYRDERNHREEYIAPEPVKPLEAISNAPTTTKKIVLKKKKELNKNTSKSQKEYTQVEIMKQKLRASSIGTSTINSYIQNIKTLHERFEKKTLGKLKQEMQKALKGQTYDGELFLQEFKYLKDKTKEVVDFLRKENTEDNSFKTKINAIVSFLGRIDGFDTEYKYLSNLGIDLQVAYTKQRDLNEITEDDLKKVQLISFDKKQIQKNAKKLPNIEDKLLYLLYMYIPRRLEMRSVEIRLNSKNTDKGNYLILNKNKVPVELIFNDYKTAKSYGKQVIAVPEDIKPLLHQYLTENDFKSKEYLFHIERDKREIHEQSQFSNKFISVFKKVYGVEITNQLLRIAYATYFNKRAKNLGEKKIYAEHLSHDITTHLQYEKYNVVN